MPLTSMTGFARVEGEAGLARWHWELRSVNGKGLDVRFRLPPGLDAIEPKLRAELARHLKRGNCQASLTVDRSAAPAPLRVNKEALRVVLDAIAELRRDIEMKPPQPEGILALRGVLESADVAEESDEVRQAFENAVVASFGEAAAALARARTEEGAKLEAMLGAHVDEIERLTQAAAASPAATAEAMRARLAAQIAELLGASSSLSERLAQEAALLATKADVREEIDRLGAHIAQAREIFAGAEPAGRRLDFLTQEFNREANTLCSKAADIGLTRIGLELKTSIDQLREQVQNVE